MNAINVGSATLTELSSAEIDVVSGAIVFAPVLVKIAAWGIGAAFGAGTVVVVSHLL